MPGGKPSNSPKVLWSKVEKRGPNECWPWKGYKTPYGYGRTWINDIGYYAHRIIFDLANPGKIEWEAPRDKFARGFLMHVCDNPSCCNPAHLRICTQHENNLDKKAKGRTRDYSGDKGPRCKLTMAQARNIRSARAKGISARNLAKAFKISLPSIKTLLRGDSYKE